MSIQRKELSNELNIVAKRVANLIQFSDTTTPIPNSQWTVGDAAAHLVISQRLARSILHGEKSPYGEGSPDFIAEVNKKYLQEFTERSGSILASMLLEEVNSFLKETKKFSDKNILPTHYGSMDILLGISYCLSHLLGHGCAIANALGKPLPVRIQHIRITIPFLKMIMLRVYDKKAALNLNASFVIDMRGIEKIVIICDAKGAKIENHIPKIVDCYISVDPLSFFLVTNGLVPQWKAFITGKLILWGKRPWLVFKLKTLFPSP
ncbi:MAG TPA: hypothetical protein VND99_03470 [Candidatus Acidoferrales bacterium]|nr:hypothetical protein [Candidatus Acidoferrales bacterium]